MKKVIQFIQISPEQLQEAIIEGVENKLEDLKAHFQPKEPTEYLTRLETAEWLKINLSTLHKWTKGGKIPCFGIGNRVYYKRKDVEAAFKRIVSSKNQ